MKNFSIAIDDDGVALVTFDIPGKSMNVISDEVQAELDAVVEMLRDSERIRGAVLISAKPSGFCAGADLPEIVGHFKRWRAARDQQALRQGLVESSSLSRRLRALETCGKPVAAAINGMALGGGLELALACHYRVAVDDPKLRLAFPETGVGLLPGAGGTQRLMRLIGIEAALPYLLDGVPITADAALAGGILHARVPADSLLDTARRWVLEHPQAQAPWDDPAFKLPGGGPHSPQGYRGFAPAIAARLANSGADHPALGNVLKCVYEGAQVPIDAGLRIESRYFFNTVRSPRAEAMARTFFISRQVLSRRVERGDPEIYLQRLRQSVLEERLAMLDEGAPVVLVNNLVRRHAVRVEMADTVQPWGEHEVDFTMMAELRQRLLYVQSLAALRCLEEGLIADPLEADAAAIEAGFPSWSGGPVSFVEVEGLAYFLESADRLAASHGNCFALSSTWRERMTSGIGPYG
ncbi:enoyl-CoA hydratase-related protein [Pseudomonas sp. R3.Fl]|uniref:enoyl-CoA hydratase-related protein n=1 Tax=Pseudomonas sp. R3.Fl TaxID=2928708 RepID=UPI00201E64E2|nr:enoyl-CoA hydratase-related protein [Pseudomonas sp. R3.Fl]MCL6692354.1 enoyl-CoA hydratase-related protein [Pseudomonas sp. R3.Fl]